MPSLPKPEVTSLKLGHSALEPSGFPLEFAKDLGLYKKYGIDSVETFLFDGAGKVTTALFSGELQASQATGGPIISSLATDSPLILVSMHVVKLAYGLFSVSAVKTPADLKGKKVAVSQFGGESHAVVLQALKGIGLGETDVTIVEIGGQSARIAALTAGSVQAAPVDSSRESTMKELGFNLLIDLSTTDLEFPRNGLMLMRSWEEKNPNTVLALVAASLEAQQQIFTNTTKAVESYARWTQAKDLEQPERDIKAYLDVAQRDFRWKKEGWEALKVIVASQNPAVANVDVTKAYTFKYLDKLKEIGFDRAVGVPGA